MSNDGEITHLLAALRDGDRSAMDRLLPLVYREFHERAHAQLARRRPGETLSTTALVHEAYLKLAGSAHQSYHDRIHFFAVASRAMRQILVDYARRKRARKRAGAVAIVSLDSVSTDAEPAACDNLPDILALDGALDELAALDMQQCQVVEMKFFGGLTIAEIADALDVSTATVEREWFSARAWLYERLSGGSVDEYSSDRAGTS